VAVVLAAMVPLLGAPLAWVPAVVYLFYTGAPTWQWTLMFAYGLLLISGIDNVVKPLLLRESAHIHPLLGFLSIVGGLLAFGVFGFLVGPVILSLLLSALRIYRLDILRTPTAPATPIAPAT
jgi:predicted PurR-regulated permease PerM